MDNLPELPSRAEVEEMVDEEFLYPALKMIFIVFGILALLYVTGAIPEDGKIFIPFPW